MKDRVYTGPYTLMTSVEDLCEDMVAMAISVRGNSAWVGRLEINHCREWRLVDPTGTLLWEVILSDSARMLSPEWKIYLPST